MNVAVVGASDNPERMSHQAVERLAAAGHRVFAVNPKFVETQNFASLPDVPALPSLAKISESIDTITLYVGADISSKLEGAIRSAKPRRVIFNPGAENPALAEKLSKSGIETLEACTLVLLSTKRF